MSAAGERRFWFEIHRVIFNLKFKDEFGAAAKQPFMMQAFKAGRE